MTGVLASRAGLYPADIAATFAALWNPAVGASSEASVRRHHGNTNKR